MLFYFYLGLGSIAEFLDSGKHDYILTNLLPHNDFLMMVIVESILLISISICLLKYKYFKHHIISLVFFVCFGMVCYSFLKVKEYLQDEKNQILFIMKIILRFFQAAFEATYFCYQKYMMEKLYYPYWNIGFLPGIILLVFSVFLLVLLIIINIKDGLIKIFSFDSYNNVILGCLKMISTLIFHIIISPLTILIIFYFSPNFILIVYQCTCIIKNLVFYPKDLLYYIFIPFYFVQILALLIYLEIFELNFCGLNKNTKRNIDLRAKEDLLDEGRDSTLDINFIDIDNDYGIEIPEKNENDELDNGNKEVITEKIE